MKPQVEASIQQLVREDLTATTALLALLEEEKAALSAHDQEQLANLADAKIAQLEALDKTAGSRYQLLQELNRESNESAWRALVEESTNASLQEDWEALLQQLAACKHHNEVNGRIIARGRVTLGRLLNLMRGQVEAPELYNQSGNTEASASPHTVVKA